MSRSFQAFIGYDPRQPVAHHVAAHSLVSRASKPLAVTRLQLNQLPITRRGLTEFTYSRFLVPYLSDFDGYSVFLDADMLVLADIWTILHGVDPLAAVSVVLHDGERAFERASLMVFNNKRCRVLTPEYVQDPANGLMNLTWASKVGLLDRRWNHLVGYDAPNPRAYLVHFTMGIPCWPETKDCEFAEDWKKEAQTVMSTVSFSDLMGSSVHVKHVAAGALR